MKYDANLHCYVKPEPNKQTNPDAEHIVSSTRITAVANPCKLQKPYYDGIACIKCEQPFILFDLDTKKCIQCDQYHLYNASTQKCEKRPVVYVSTNYSNVMATPGTNLTEYKKQLFQRVNNSGDAIVKKCADGEYSNGTACFSCKVGENFNIETQKCQVCNGTIDATTRICKPRKTMLTDLNATNLILSPDKNLSKYTE